MQYRVEFHRILLILVMVMVCATGAKKREMSLTALKKGQRITGKGAAEFKVGSSDDCAIRCLMDKDCQAYQYQHKGTRAGNCILIHSTDGGREQFGYSDNSETFMKASLRSWLTEIDVVDKTIFSGQNMSVLHSNYTEAETTTTEAETTTTEAETTTTEAETTTTEAETTTTAAETITTEAETTTTAAETATTEAETTTTAAQTTTTEAQTTTTEAQTTTTEAETTTTEAEKITFTAGWTGPDAVLCWSFDNKGDVVTMEGTSRVNFDPIVPGKVNNSLTLDHTKKQWVDLGIHTEACMTRPETCGSEGGAISMWVKVIDCPSSSGIVSSQSVIENTGFRMVCESSTIQFMMRIKNGYFWLSSPKPTIWTHVVMNYIGPSDAEEIRIYYDGTQVASDTKDSNSYSPGDGRIVVGRYYTNINGMYASVQVDELIFFNQTLSNDTINLLYTEA